jgi:predicted DNA-binding protein YlxM (UPF0122 family)
MKRDNRKKYRPEAVAMYESGLSIQEVADFYQISRQAMWQWLTSHGAKFRSQKRYGQENPFYRGGRRASDLAQNLAEKAVEKGILQRSSVCENCGQAGHFKDGRTSIQAHHADYNKPLEVTWLCQRCHHAWHKEHKPIERR